MGRHSTPDDPDDPSVEDVGPAQLVGGAPAAVVETGRHNLGDASTATLVADAPAPEFAASDGVSGDGWSTATNRSALGFAVPYGRSPYAVDGPGSASADARDFVSRAREQAHPVEVPVKTSRAGRNLPAAIGVSLGLGAMIIASLLIYRPSFVVIICVAMSYGIFEMVRAIGAAEARPPLVPLVVGGLAMDIAAWFHGAGGLVLGLLITVLGVTVWRLAEGAVGYARDVTSAAFIALYVPALGGFAVLLTHYSDGAGRVIAFIATVVCSDVGGYTAGVLFGKHPMAPTVSPKKSWEGFVGSARGLLHRRRVVHGGAVPPPLVARRALRAGDRGDGHPRRPRRIDGETRPRRQGHGPVAARARRAHGPPRLAAALRRRGLPDPVGRAGVIGADSSVSTAENYAQFGRDAGAESPRYEEFGLGVSADPDVLALLARLPVPKRQPNLLFAAVRFVAGTPVDYADFRRTVLTRWDEIGAQIRRRSTQTNEASRCATLLPFLARLPQPLALLEVGASAGLCLLPDLYRYEFTDPAGVVTAAGPADAPLTLTCGLDGIEPPTQVPTVAWRAGLDLHPIDPFDPDQIDWLDALVWPGAEDRLARLHTALEVVRSNPPRIETGDLRHDLPALAAQAPPDATLVVFHSAVLAYLDQLDRSTFARTVSGMDATWIVNESPRVSADLGVPIPKDLRPSFLISVDGVAQAWSEGHGSWLAAI